MAAFSQTVIVGNVGRDATLRYTPAGKAVADFSVAVTERWGSGDNKQEKTSWFKVTVWDKQAEVANQYVKKGMQILVSGRVSVSAYTDKAGQPAASLELTAQTMQFLGSANGGNGHTEPAPDQAADEPEFNF